MGPMSTPQPLQRRYKTATDVQATKSDENRGLRPEPCANCGVRHRTKTVEECVDERMSERTLQDRVVDRAKRRGWRVAHAGKGFVGDAESGAGQFITPMAPGWPDLTLAKAGHSLIFMELKRQTGVVDEKQVEWLQLLNQTGNIAIVVRPSDLREGKVTAILNGGRPL